MSSAINGRVKAVFVQAPLGIAFILGIWLVVLRPLGPNLALVPGDLGDARFNNYVLEHFFRFISGLTKDYWNAPFFYPFQRTIAFSDNLLGSAPFYVLFRWVGLDMESAFQGWFVLGYCLNYAAAGYVLRRFKLSPLAAAAGAFFFAFGLPLLAQENHPQLLYRFCIPLACFNLWQFYQMPKLRTLAALGAWLVWQFYLTIYMGVFLLFLLAALVILLPFFVPVQSFWQRFALWPRQLIKSWSQAYNKEKILTLITIAVLVLGLAALILPYYRASRIYSFTRDWTEVSSMLPRPRSYLLADHSQVWPTTNIYPNLDMRWEHQLFPGVAVPLLVLAGVIGRFRTETRRLAWLNLAAALVLVALTLEFRGFSLYHLIWQIPGLSSIRAVTRIMLVVMWPLSVVTAWVIDGFIQQFSRQHQWMQGIVYLVVGLLLVESVFYSHQTFDKADAQARLDRLRQQIPATVPANPILILATNQKEPSWTTDIDAMLLSQQLGWPTVNGYSGNFPSSYTPPDSCEQLPHFIRSYMDFAGISDPTFFQGILKRVVPVGFAGCDPSW